MSILQDITNIGTSIAGAVNPFTGMIAGIGNLMGSGDSFGSNMQNMFWQNWFADQKAAAANAFSAEQAKVARDFTEQQISRQLGFQEASQQKQFDFQERMSNTAYQRAIKDLKGAGLNPMLAYAQGGASSPGGSAMSGAAGSATPAGAHMATTAQFPSKPNRLGQAMAAGLTAARQVAEIDNISADAALKRAQVPNVEQQTQTGATTASKLLEEARLVERLADKVQDEREALQQKARHDKAAAERVEKLTELERMLKALEVEYRNYERPRHFNQYVHQRRNEWFYQNAGGATMHGGTNSAAYLGGLLGKILGEESDTGFLRDLFRR